MIIDAQLLEVLKSTTLLKIFQSNIRTVILVNVLYVKKNIFIKCVDNGLKNRLITGKYGKIRQVGLLQIRLSNHIIIQ